jgi:hypothetical protein
MPPVALGVEIAEKNLVLKPEINCRDGARYLSGDECFAA